MLRKKKNGITWLEFELLQLFPEVKHGVLLGLPLEEARFEENGPKVQELFGAEKCARLKQCHKKDVIEVRKAGLFEEYDGMVTAEKGVGLFIRHADCQGAIFYDPIHHAIGSVHCGWRGSVSNIYQETIKEMETLYGTDPEDLIVCIGPSLGPEAAEFKHYKEELPEHFWPFQIKPFYFDFWEISRMQLIEGGVPEEQIEVAEICTFSNEKDCYSYRRNKNTSLFGTFVVLS